jgi:hypothetical protein
MMTRWLAQVSPKERSLQHQAHRHLSVRVQIRTISIGATAGVSAIVPNFIFTVILLTKKISATDVCHRQVGSIQR